MQNQNQMEILTQEEARKGLLEKFKEHLGKLFAVMKAGGKVEDVAMESAQGEEEKETLKLMLDEIHGYHQNLRDLHAEQEADPDLTESEWLEKKLQETAKDWVREVENREMTPDEKDALMKEYNRALDDEIERETHEVEKISKLQEEVVKDVEPEKEETK